MSKHLVLLVPFSGQYRYKQFLMLTCYQYHHRFLVAYTKTIIVTFPSIPNNCALVSFMYRYASCSDLILFVTWSQQLHFPPTPCGSYNTVKSLVECFSHKQEKNKIAFTDLFPTFNTYRGFIETLIMYKW